MELYTHELKTLPKGVTRQGELTLICRKRFGRKYHGTYGADQLPNLKPYESAIVNLDRSDQPGSHWIALYRGMGKKVYVYDSFGRLAGTLIPALKGNVVDADQDAEQDVNESNCGSRCVAWLTVCYMVGVRHALSI